MPSITFRRNVISEDTKTQMIQDYINGVPVQKIIENHKVSKPTLYRYLKIDGTNKKDKNDITG
jgi:hypothetical protein